MRRTLALGSFGGAAAIAACSLVTNLDDLRGGDAAVNDAPIDTSQPPPDGGCTVAISPSLIKVAPGGATTATITVSRGASVTGNATITFDAVPYFTVPSITIGAADTTGPAAFTGAATAQPSAVDMNVLATFENGSVECKTLATVAITGILATFPGNGNTFVVPTSTFLTQLDFDVWGAGGGGGGDNGSQTVAGSGGGGGLSYALFDVTPGETLNVLAGTGGAPGGYGAGGGGCSEVLRGTTLLIVGAGGGGGGGGELYIAGASGGGAGQPGGTSGNAKGGGAGTSTAGGVSGTGGTNASDGGVLEGGRGGGNSGSTGGVPGGGKGGVGGGGGCGAFGGGGGGDDTTDSSGAGGGGGSGTISTAVDGGVALAMKTNPPLDPRFSPSDPINALAGAALGGANGTNPQASTATAGGPGRVVISIPP